MIYDCQNGSNMKRIQKYPIENHKIREKVASHLALEPVRPYVLVVQQKRQGRQPVGRRGQPLNKGLVRHQARLVEAHESENGGSGVAVDENAPPGDHFTVDFAGEGVLGAIRIGEREREG